MGWALGCLAALVLLLCPFTGSSNPPPEHIQSSDLPHPQNMPCMLSLAQASLCLPGDTGPLHPPLTAHQGLPNHPSKALTFRQGMLSTSQKCTLCQMSTAGPSPATRPAASGVMTPALHRRRLHAGTELCPLTLRVCCPRSAPLKHRV